MPPQTFILIGRSGSGKGTQAELLIKYLEKKEPARKIFYLETGQTFRDLLKKETLTSRLSREINEKGELQPEFLAVWAWSHLLVEGLRGDEHLIIDGTPRKLREAAVLDSAFKFYGRKNPAIINVQVSAEWSREKLLGRKRADDTEEDIARRLGWYETDVVPAIDYFRDRDDYRVLDINGEQTIENVYAEIMRKVFGL